MTATYGFLTRPRLGEQPTPTPPGRRARAALSVTTLGIQGFARLAMGVALARTLGVEHYGVFATALSFAALIAMLWPSSTGAAVTRFVGQAQGRRQYGEASIWGMRAARLAIYGALLAMTASSIGWIFWQGGDIGTSLAVGLLSFGVSLQLFARANNLVVGNYMREAVLGIGTTALGCGGAVVAAKAGLSTGPVIATLSLGYLLFAFSSWPAADQVHRGSDLHGKTRLMSHYVTIVAIGSIASAGFLQAGILVVGQIAGRAEAGIFGAAMTLATPMALAAASGSLLLNPALARLKGSGDTEHAARLLRIASGAYTTFFFLVLTTFSLVGDTLTVLIFGEPFEGASQPALALLTGIALTGLAAPSVALLSMGELTNARVTTIYTWIGAGVGAAIWAWNATQMEGDATWIAAGFAVGTFVTCIANVMRAAANVRSSPPFISIAVLCAPLTLTLAFA